MKNKTILKMSFELLKEILMLPLDANIEEIVVNRYNETLEIKVQADTSKQMLSKDIPSVNEAEQIPFNSLNYEDVYNIKLKSLLQMANSLSNIELTKTILAFADTRENLKEFIAKQIITDKDKRDLLL